MKCLDSRGAIRVSTFPPDTPPPPPPPPAQLIRRRGEDAEEISSGGNYSLRSSLQRNVCVNLFNIQAYLTTRTFALLDMNKYNINI